MGFIARKSKYGAVKTVTPWGSFPSKLESAVYQLLLYREKAGEIRNIRRQVPVRLREKCDHCGSGSVVFKVDFSFEDVSTGQTVFCEAKGCKTASYMIRERIWRKNPPGRLEIWGGSYRKPGLIETLEADKETNCQAAKVP